MSTEQNQPPTNGNGSATSTATALADAPREKLSKKAITADHPFLSLRERTEVRVKI